MKKLLVLSLMISCFCMTSCSDDDNTETGGKSEVDNNEIAVTEPSTEVGASYAILNGRLFLSKIPAGSTFVSVGFDLSMDKDFINEQTRRAIVRGIEGNKLTLTIDTLSPQTTYYYRTVVELNNMEFYGAKQTFTTKELEMTPSVGDVSNITFTSAKVNFKVTHKAVSKFETVVAGMAYSEDKRFLQADSIISLIGKGYGYGGMSSNGLNLINERRCSNMSDGTVQTVIDGLEPSHTYYYCTYVRAGNKLVMSEVKSFSTIDFQAQQLVSCEASDVTLATATVSGITSMTSTLADIYPNMADIVWGISYAPEESLAQTTWPKNWISGLGETSATISGNNFTAKLTNLTPSTNYLYCPFVRIGDAVLRGDVKRFTTKSLDDYLMIDIDDIGFTSAKISGKTQLQDLFQNISYTFNYRYKTDYYDWDNSITMTVAGNSLSADLKSLSCGKTYNYWVTVLADGQKLQTGEKTFKSQDPKDYITMSDAANVTSSSAEVTCSVDPKVYAGSIIGQVIYGLSKENMSQYAHDTVDGKTMKATMSGLSSGTTYYYYAQVLFTIGLGQADWYTTDIKSFTTK
jgi:hypothetical protein